MTQNKITFEQKLSIILDDRKYSPTEWITFSAHEAKFRPILEDLLKEANKKIAVLHAKTSVNTDRFDERSMLSCWQEGRDLSTQNNLFFNWPVARINNQSAYARFNCIKEKFTTQPDLSRIRLEITENAGKIHESLLISKSIWGRLHTHDFYDEMGSRFTTLFTNLNLADLEFLVSYVQWDEHGVLFLFWKYIYCKLGYILSSQLIIAVYKPGAFIEFLNKAVIQARSLIHSSYKISNLILSKSICKITFIGLASVSFGLTLFSNYFTGNPKISVFSLHSGFSGNPGEVLDSIRDIGSKVVFEVAKTVSVLTNAALIGFLEPKQNLIKHLLKRD
jgi:hypothetical protein